MAILFQDDFENDFNEWTYVYQTDGRTVSVQSGIKHHGSYAASFFTSANAPNGATRARKTTGAEYSQWHFRGYVYFANLALNSGAFKRIIGADNILKPSLSTGISLAVVNDGGTYKWRVAVRNNSAWAITNLASPLLETGKWYCVELYAKIGSVDGEARLWIDGVLVTEATVLNNADRGNAYNFDIGFDFYDTGVVAGDTTVYWDCVAVADTYIGPEKLWLTVQSNPELNVRVYVDGVLVGNTPIQVGMSEGTHTVRVEEEVLGE